MSAAALDVLCVVRVAPAGAVQEQPQVVVGCSAAVAGPVLPLLVPSLAAHAVCCTLLLWVGARRLRLHSLRAQPACHTCTAAAAQPMPHPAAALCLTTIVVLIHPALQRHDSEG